MSSTGITRGLLLEDDDNDLIDSIDLSRANASNAPRVSFELNMMMQ